MMPYVARRAPFGAAPANDNAAVDEEEPEPAIEPLPLEHHDPPRTDASVLDAIQLIVPDTDDHAVVQKKEAGTASTEDPHATARDGVASGGSSLPFLDVIQRAFGRHDVTGVQAHTGTAAQDASQALGARAYAFGNHVAFAGAPDLHTAAHEAAHIVQQRQGVSLKGGVGEAGDAYERHADAVADRVVAGESAEDLLGELAPPTTGAAIQKREINPDGDHDRDTDAAHHMTTQDWLKSDRERDTPVWRRACQTNLMSGAHGDASQYQQIEERRDFYLWFYNAACARGFETRWALAAYLVANGAAQVANMDANAVQALANVIGSGVAPLGLQAAMRQGNQMIFDNVLPKLRKLWEGQALTGQDALRWDMQTLAEEQALVQPMYNALGANKAALDNVAHKWGFWVVAGVGLTRGDVVPPGPNRKGGTIPGLPDDADIAQPLSRWEYGMTLGNQFAPKPTGYVPGMPMPAVGSEYQMNGASNPAFEAANTQPHLHQLDAYLNRNYIGDRTNGMGTANNYLESIITALTGPEKEIVLLDRMPDGNRYSTAMGLLGGLIILGMEPLYGVTDAQANACMPKNADPDAVARFMTNFKSVRALHMRTT